MFGSFNGRIVFFGYGGVGRCLVRMLTQDFELNPARCLFLDARDMRADLAWILERGAKFIQQRITKETLHTTVRDILSPGDLLVDLTVNIDSYELVQLCRDRQVLYVDAAVEEWDPFANAGDRSPQERSLYYRQAKFQELRGTAGGVTALLDSGANPGLVSTFTKVALAEIANYLLKDKPRDPRKQQLERALADDDYPNMSRLLGIKVIHVSERDTQVLRVPKRMGEFVNTWSVDGLIEESVAPAELGWGTHERKLPYLACEHAEGPRNQICIARMGMKTRVRSWVPSGPMLAMVIRHGEAFTISHYLTVKQDGKDVYRPTVHYAYCPCDAAIASLWEFESRNFEPPEHQRVVSADDIDNGRDELGVLLMGHDYESWWYGSLLDVEEARRLVPGQSATTVQVAAGLASGIGWMLENPKRGVVTPEDLDPRYVMKKARPYLGPMFSQAVDWHPAIPRKDRSTFGNYNGIGKTISYEDRWQFTSFFVV